MIIVEVYYRAKPGMREKILELAKPNVEGSRKEKGNLSYTHYPSPENDQDVFVFEKWESFADLDAHGKTEHHRTFSAARAPLLESNSFKITIWDSELNEAQTKSSQEFANRAINY